MHRVDRGKRRAKPDLPGPGGRLWDVLYLAAVKARSLRGRRQNQLLYELRVVPRPGHDHPHLRTLKLVIGPGDDAEPVATIMLPNED